MSVNNAPYSLSLRNTLAYSACFAPEGNPTEKLKLQLLSCSLSRSFCREWPNGSTSATIIQEVTVYVYNTLNIMDALGKAIEIPTSYI